MFILVLLATFIVGLGIYRMCLPNYRVGDYRLNEAHYLAGVAHLEAGQFDQAVSEFSVCLQSLKTWFLDQ